MNRHARAMRLCAVALTCFPANAARAQEIGPSSGGQPGAATAALSLYGGQATLAPLMFPGPPQVVRSTMGAGIDVVLRDPFAPTSGLTLLVGEAMEHRGECPDRPYQDCPWPSGNGPAQVQIEEIQRIPGPKTAGAWHARLGYAGDWIALQAGAVAVSYWTHDKQARRELRYRPDLLVLLGSGPVRFVVGYGAFSASTMFGPGPYLQVRGTIEDLWHGRATLAWPLFDGEDYAAARLDGMVMRRVAGGLGTGAGAAITVGPGVEFRWVTSVEY